MIMVQHGGLGGFCSRIENRDAFEYVTPFAWGSWGKYGGDFEYLVA